MLAIEMVLQAVPPFLRPCCDDPSILPRKPPGSRELDTTPHDQRMTSKGPWWFLTSCPAQLVRRHLRRLVGGASCSACPESLDLERASSIYSGARGSSLLADQRKRLEIL